MDGIAVLIAPMGDEGTITHVSLLYLMSWCDTYQLGHQTVHHIGVILRFICFLIRRQTQFHQFVIRYIIKSEQVGTGFLNRVAISLQAIRIHPRQQLSATVTQTFVKVSMQVIADVAIFLYRVKCDLIDHELLLETTPLRSLIISIGNIADSDALRTIASADPVCIRQIDTDSCRGIFLTAQHGCTDHIGRNTMHHSLFKPLVYGRMIFEPLGIAGDGLRAMSSLLIDVFYNTFPRAFQSQGIPIHLDKTIDEIDGSIVLSNPFNAIFIKNP